MDGKIQSYEFLMLIFAVASLLFMLYGNTISAIWLWVVILFMKLTVIEMKIERRDNK